MSPDEINAIESESGVVATLIHHPDYVFNAEHLEPIHFTNTENKCMYMAIRNMARRGVETIDPYNIISYLSSSEATKEFASVLTVEKLNEFMEMSDVLARHTTAEYLMLVENILDAAFRRDAFRRLRECEALCSTEQSEVLQQRICAIGDDLAIKYGSTKQVPLYKDVVDDCWAETCARRKDGYAGIPFKFKTLNQMATIEAGELFVFVAEAKQGKSMMLLNCAADLLRQGLSVMYLDSELNTRLFNERLISHLTGIETKKVKTGAYSQEEERRIMEALAWLKQQKFVHHYMPIFDQQNVFTAIKKVHHMIGIDVIIVDYFKSSGDGDAFSTYQELGHFVDMIKNKVCGDLGICGIGAAQATANGRVADSAKIGRNASTIALITDKTPDEIEMDGVECGNKKLRIVLNRNGNQHAPGEYIDLLFNGGVASYEEAKQHLPHIPY